MLWVKQKGTTEEIKGRWPDIRRGTKEKIAHSKTLANKTGVWGGGVLNLSFCIYSSQYFEHSGKNAR